jgi:hypothetical protein
MTGIVLLLLWAGYHFNIQRIVSPTEKQDFVRVLNQRVGQPAVIAMASRLADVPVPGGGLLRGFLELANHNAKGHPSYLLGRYSTAGFWDFFPVVLSVKTPIGFLLLALCGMAMVLYHFREAPWQHRVTALFPIAIFLVCMSSRINIGVRHILPIYVPMAVLAGHAATWLWAQWKTRWVAIALALWVVAASAMIHPDYLAYFNEIAGSHPEKIIVDSDLDWGQDLDRLSARMRELHIDHLGLRYFGNAPVSSAELPPYTILKPNEVTEGYVAISLRTRETDHAHDPTAWSWLYFRKPIERIGKSIDLYYITAENAK